MTTRDAIAHTWIADESYGQPLLASWREGYRRPGRAMCPDGKTRAIRAGFADTFFTCPARVKYRGKTVSGFLMTRMETEHILWFHPTGTNAALFPYSVYDIAGSIAAMARG